MKHHEAGYYRPWPAPGTFLIFFLFVAVLLPGLRLVLENGFIDKAMAQMAGQCPAPGGQVVWAMSQPGMFVQRMICAGGMRLARPELVLPLASLFGAGLLLTLLSRRKDRWDNRSARTVVLAACLGANPLFLNVALTGASWIWVAVAWFLAVRAMCRIEGSDSIQQEMGLGFALATIMVVEPAAGAFVLLTAMLLPFILKHNSHRSIPAAMALILIPPILMAVAQLLAYVLLSGTSIIAVASQWSQGLAMDVSFISHDSVATVGIVGFMGPLMNRLPYLLGPVVVFTPIIPLFVMLPFHFGIRYRPASLVASGLVPLAVGFLFSWRLGWSVQVPWVLLVLVGLIAWLSETRLGRRGDKIAIGLCCVWVLVGYLV